MLYFLQPHTLIACLSVIRRFQSQSRTAPSTAPRAQHSHPPPFTHHSHRDQPLSPLNDDFLATLGHNQNFSDASGQFLAETRATFDCLEKEAEELERSFQEFQQQMSAGYLHEVPSPLRTGLAGSVVSPALSTSKFRHTSSLYPPPPTDLPPSIPLRVTLSTQLTDSYQATITTQPLLSTTPLSSSKPLHTPHTASTRSKLPTSLSSLPPSLPVGGVTFTGPVSSTSFNSSVPPPLPVNGGTPAGPQPPISSVSLHSSKLPLTSEISPMVTESVATLLPSSESTHHAHIQGSLLPSHTSPVTIADTQVISVSNTIVSTMALPRPPVESQPSEVVPITSASFAQPPIPLSTDVVVSELLSQVSATAERRTAEISRSSPSPSKTTTPIQSTDHLVQSTTAVTAPEPAVSRLYDTQDPQSTATVTAPEPAVFKPHRVSLDDLWKPSTPPQWAAEKAVEKPLRASQSLPATTTVHPVLSTSGTCIAHCPFSVMMCIYTLFPVTGDRLESSWEARRHQRIREEERRQQEEEERVRKELEALQKMESEPTKK